MDAFKYVPVHENLGAHFVLDVPADVRLHERPDLLGHLGLLAAAVGSWPRSDGHVVVVEEEVANRVDEEWIVDRELNCLLYMNERNLHFIKSTYMNLYTFTFENNALLRSAFPRQVITSSSERKGMSFDKSA